MTNTICIFTKKNIENRANSCKGCIELIGLTEHIYQKLFDQYSDISIDLNMLEIVDKYPGVLSKHKTCV